MTKSLSLVVFSANSSTCFKDARKKKDTKKKYWKESVSSTWTTMLIKNLSYAVIKKSFQLHISTIKKLKKKLKIQRKENTRENIFK